jgi:sec-independent protein translocase protein TatC
MTEQQDPSSHSRLESLIAGGKVMSIWDHLDELRTRIVWTGLGLIVIFVVSLTFSDHIFAVLKRPLIASLPVGASALHFTGPMDVFMVNIKVAFLVSVIFGCPWWLFQFWKFFEPALYPSERKYILPFIFASVAFFAIGVLFCFHLMLPAALKYLIGIGLKVGTPIITVTDYVSLVTVMILGFGFIFETPVILVLLAMLDIVTAEALANNRRVMFVVILIVAAIITPPDPFSMIGMALPCYAMYELSIIVIRFLKRKRHVTPS